MLALHRSATPIAHPASSMSVFAKEIAVRRLSKSRPALRRPAWWPTARSPNRQRNRVRLPAYPRADVRISKSLQWKSWRATLFAEIMNLANRDNERYDSFGGYNAQTRQAFPRFDKLFPIIPAAGIMFEWDALGWRH